MNNSQRAVISGALGISLFVFSQWFIGRWDSGSQNFGWVAYSPLSNTVHYPRHLLCPWVVLLIYLILTLLWMMTSVALFHRTTITIDGSKRTIDP
ncbi:MAG: hypothetical protein ABI298_09000 [Acidimicrobiales bacterium]